MLSGLGQTGTGTNYGTMAAGNTQTAILAGYTPSQWAQLTADEQRAALAQAGAFPTPVTPPETSTALIQAAVATGQLPSQYTGQPSGGGTPLISFGTGGQPLITFGATAGAPATGQPTAAQIQQAVNAGYTPQQFAAMTPAQRQAALTAAGVSQPASMMPILLIGGGLLLLVMFAGKKH